jgi:hypothetical protein
MNARNLAARFALFTFLGSAAFLIVAGGMAPGLKAQALPDPPAKSITGFVTCINTKLWDKNKTDPVSIADTVACVPPKCSVIVTMSGRSDQPACAIDIPNVNVQFPRVVFSCPGSKADLQLRPSYSLCPERGQHKTLELAEDVKPGAMVMASVPIQGPKGEPTIDKGKFMKIVDNQVKNQPNGNANGNTGTKGCNACHFAVGNNETDGNFLLSKPIDPLSANAVWRSSNDNLKKYVLFANQGDLSGLGKFCQAIKNNNAALTKAPFGPSAADLAVIISLCGNLTNYKP